MTEEEFAAARLLPEQGRGGWIRPSIDDLVIIHARRGLEAEAICAEVRASATRVAAVLERGRLFGFLEGAPKTNEAAA